MRARCSSRRVARALVTGLALSVTLTACAAPSTKHVATKQRATPSAPATQPTARPTRAGATPAAALAVSLPSPLESLPATGDTAPGDLTGTPGGGGFTQVTIPGPASGHTGTAYVWFPPSYGTPGHETTRYPVIEVFHGYKPSPLGFFTYYHLDETMAQLVRQRRLREAIIVIPDWAPGGLDTECVDGGGQNVKMETWLTQDVPEWLARTYRTARDRASWAGYGASTGGWCALMAATLHPQTLGAAISLGGQGYPEFDPPYIPFQPDSDLGRRYDLTRVLREQAPPVALWLLTATTDKYSYPTSHTMIQAAKAPTSLDAVVLDSGRHHPMFWLPHVPASLTWLGTAAPGFAATP